MSYILKNVLGTSLLLVGIAGFSGCASMDADVASLERQLAAKEERIETLEMSKSDMQRVIELKNADLERYQKTSMTGQYQASMKGDSLPKLRAGECYARVHKTHGVDTMWQPVLCKADTTPSTARQIQRALKQTHHYHGAIDGIVGPQTRRAVRSYQRANGLHTGGLTFETLESLGLKMHDRKVVAGAR